MRRRKPGLRQVVPIGIHGVDHAHFSDPRPAFDLFLTADRTRRILSRLIVHQPTNSVAPCKSRESSCAVFPHPVQREDGARGDSALDSLGMMS